jgi:hypothetical protein
MDTEAPELLLLKGVCFFWECMGQKKDSDLGCQILNDKVQVRGNWYVGCSLDEAGAVGEGRKLGLWRGLKRGVGRAGEWAWLAFIVYLRGSMRGSNPNQLCARLGQIPARHIRHSTLLLCLSTLFAI